MFATPPHIWCKDCDRGHFKKYIYVHIWTFHSIASKRMSFSWLPNPTRINNPAPNCNTGKMHIPEIFNSLLGINKSSDGSYQAAEPSLSQGHPTWCDFDWMWNVEDTTQPHPLSDRVTLTRCEMWRILPPIDVTLPGCEICEDTIPSPDDVILTGCEMWRISPPN